MKNLKTLIHINTAGAALFSLLMLWMHADVSMLAFPVAAVFFFFLFRFSEIEIVRRESPARLSVVRRFFQYEPFVFITAFVLQRSGEYSLPYAFDLVCALLWVALTVCSMLIQHRIHEKRLARVCAAWKEYSETNTKKKPHGLRRVVYEALDWVDAIIQAVFTIILLNIFLFQLYEIPSESMVPTFLVKDRVLVFKTLSGPRFPLSEVGLPYIQDYDRGDIVVFRNPHYKNDHKSEVKSFLSQFVYMCTLTMVNTNTDENGELKADPLVKRITGLPGEQLMMVDGTLYTRTEGSSEFKPVPQDEKWAAWGLSGCKQAFNIDRNRMNVELFPVAGILKREVKTADNRGGEAYLSLKDAVNYENEKENETLQVESLRRNMDLESARLECDSLAREFASLARGKNVSEKELESSRFNDYLYVKALYAGLESLSDELLRADGGSQWFTRFMTSWYVDMPSVAGLKNDGSVTGPCLAGGDLYTDSCFRLDVMTKLLAGRIICENARKVSAGISRNRRTSNKYADQQKETLRMVRDYIIRMNQRNMGIFPPNESNGTASYIPEDNFFMMGDNRYNSLDMRHRYRLIVEPLSTLDSFSVTYESNMEPQYVPKKSILGKAAYRFWPLDRMGRPR